MWKYASRRLLIAIPVLFVISVLDFGFINLAPGDPLQAMLPQGEAGGASSIESMYEKSGLRDSLPVRYVRWIGELAQGNFGKSYRSGEPVRTVIGRALPNTLLLTFSAMIIGLVIGIPLGIASALRERSFLDEVVTLFSFIFTAIPSFFLALLAVFVLAVRVHWFPATGMRSYTGPSGLSDLLHHLILPAMVLGVLQVPVYVRYMRGAILDVLGEDYIQTARAKGLRERTIIRRHTMPNALLPVVTIVGLRLPALVGSSVLVEQVFAWPGLGTLSINSALFRDYPVFMGTALLYAAAVLLSSIITDVAYALINPRIRYA
ncbi:MAG TPA: ABC transporter permease [Thermomicrobiales bacterium]|jgi:peptide/nickel transport system permease protein|nr:ABC transporter permease [Thermomicrobiales bacterium]